MTQTTDTVGDEEDPVRAARRTATQAYNASQAQRPPPATDAIDTSGPVPPMPNRTGEEVEEERRLTAEAERLEQVYQEKRRKRPPAAPSGTPWPSPPA
jgi:hypothetical protein